MIRMVVMLTRKYKVNREKIEQTGSNEPQTRYWVLKTVLFILVGNSFPLFFSHKTQNPFFFLFYFLAAIGAGFQSLRVLGI
ncbi:unnamed protein product [Lathyrus sativus]|nr:unnamed protein product [Lathyrus sativus]